MLTTRRLSVKSSFTLIEVVVATAVLGIGLFVVGTVFVGELATISQLRDTMIATLAAQEEIDTVRGMQFDSILGLGSHFTFNSSTIPCLSQLKNPQGDGYLDKIYNSDDNMRRVSIKVTWSSVTGKTLSKNLATLVTRYGIDKR